MFEKSRQKYIDVSLKYSQLHNEDMTTREKWILALWTKWLIEKLAEKPTCKVLLSKEGRVASHDFLQSDTVERKKPSKVFEDH